jgi:hypothetical protein
MIFKKLSPEEEFVFRQWAAENDPPNLERLEIYHPVCREVWEARGFKPE